MEVELRKVNPVEITHDLKVLVKTGKVVFGSRQTLENVMHGRGKLVILAKNAPEEYAEDIIRYARMANIPVVIFDGTNVELGQLCGKMFKVSAMLIFDFGESALGKKLGVE